MKNLPTMSSQLCLVVLLAMVVGATFWQSSKGAQASNAPSNPYEKYQWLVPMIPPNILHALNLAADQEAGMKNVMATYKPTAEALSDKMAEARWKMNDAIMSSDLNQALVNSRTEDLASAWGAIIESEADVFLKARKYLTPEQVTLFNKMRGAMRSRQPSFPKVPLRVVGEPFLKSLNLTPAQQEQVEAIYKQHGDDSIAINRRLYEAKVAVEQAIMTDNHDEAVVQRHSKDAAAARGDLIKLHAQVLLQIRSVLTPEQISTFRQENRERGERFLRY